MRSKWNDFSDIEKELKQEQKPDFNLFDKFIIWLSKGNNKRNFKIGAISSLIVTFLSLWISLVTVPSVTWNPINSYNRDHNSGTYEVFVNYGLEAYGYIDSRFTNSDGEPIFNEYVRTVDNNTQIANNVDNYENTIGYASSLLTESYDNVRSLKFYWEYDITKLSPATFSLFGNNLEEGLYYLPRDIDPTTGAKLSSPYEEEFIFALDSNNDSVITEDDTFLIYPTEDSVKQGYYTLSRNFHIAWIDEDFYDFENNDIYDISTWPINIDSDKETTEEAISFAFFVYTVFCYDSEVRNKSITDSGIYVKPEDSKDGIWPSNSVGVNDITNWLKLNGLTDSELDATVRIQGSTSTISSISKVFNSFVIETGLKGVYIDQGNSAGSSSAFNDNSGVYIGTQSRIVKSTEMEITYEEKGSTEKGNGSMVQENGSSSEYYNYFAYATDSLSLMVNDSLNRKISWATPEILWDIYLSEEGATWSNLMVKYYE